MSRKQSYSVYQHATEKTYHFADEKVIQEIEENLDQDLMTYFDWISGHRSLEAAEARAQKLSVGNDCACEIKA